MTGAVILASLPFRPPDNGHQLELVSPYHSLEASLKAFLQIPLEELILVLGHDYHHILNGLKSLPSSAKIVIHRKPERGLGSALAVGLQALNPEITSVVISRGDQAVESRVIKYLIQAFEGEAGLPSGRKRIVVPLYHGKRGLPWVVSCELKKSLLELEGELTLGAFLKNRRKDVLALPVEGQPFEEEIS